MQMTPHGTISGADWARALPAARTRRQVATARRFAGPVCPRCGRPGLHRELTGGTEILHSGVERCFIPPPRLASGIVTTQEEAA